MKWKHRNLHSTHSYLFPSSFFPTWINSRLHLIDSKNVPTHLAVQSAASRFSNFPQNSTILFFFQTKKLEQRWLNRFVNEILFERNKAGENYGETVQVGKQFRRIPNCRGTGLNSWSLTRNGGCACSCISCTSFSSGERWMRRLNNQLFFFYYPHVTRLFVVKEIGTLSFEIRED